MTALRRAVGGVVTTKAQAEGAIEGQVKDYRLASPFSSSFAFSRFSMTRADFRNASLLRGTKRFHARNRRLASCACVSPPPLPLQPPQPLPPPPIFLTPEAPAPLSPPPPEAPAPLSPPIWSSLAITMHQTDCQDLATANAIYLDRHTVACPTGTVLTSFYFSKNEAPYPGGGDGCSNNQTRYHYSCIEDYTSYGTTTEHFTGCQVVGGDLSWLDRISDLQCSEGSVLTGFQYQPNHCGDSSSAYRYTCAPTAAFTARDSSYTDTDCQDISATEIQYLERLKPGMAGLAGPEELGAWDGCVFSGFNMASCGAVTGGAGYYRMYRVTCNRLPT